MNYTKPEIRNLANAVAAIQQQQKTNPPMTDGELPSLDPAYEADE